MTLFDLLAQPDAPIIVDVIQVPSYTLGDVVVKAIGISGVVAASGVLLGLVLGGAFIAFRIRARRLSNAPTDHQRLHLSV